MQNSVNAFFSVRNMLHYFVKCDKIKLLTMEKIDIIANLSSGKGNGRECLEKAAAYLREQCVPYEVHETQRKGHAKELAEKLSAQGVKVIVALGGDGTFHEVLNGIDFSVSRMGMIPAGRGNDFASFDTQKAIEAIVNGVPRDLDYIQVADKRCINIAGTGLDVEVLLKTAKSKNKLSYVASLFRCLLKFKLYRVEAEVNGETRTYDCVMAGVCNGSQFGGGIRLSPVSVADDGKLDLIIMQKPKHTPCILIMPTFVKGKHMNKPYTTHVVCESVKITPPANTPLELDGEIYYGLPFEASIVKKGLKTFKQLD